MSFANDTQRARILESVLYATSAEEVSQATQMLDRWLDQHPDDLGIVDGYELLANLQDAAEEQEAARRPLATAGRAA